MTMELTAATEPVITEPRLDPWLSMWTQPRRTTRQLLADGVDGRVLLLAALSGIVEVLDRASGKNLGDHVAVIWIVIMALVLGPLIGIVSLYVGAWMVAFTGRWLGGNAHSSALRIPLAWSGLPLATGALALWLAGLVLFGSDLFTAETPRIEQNIGLAFLMMGWGLALMVLGVWSIVLSAKSIAEAQGYSSAWRGLANIILPGLIIFGIVVGMFAFIAVLFAMVAP